MSTAVKVSSGAGQLIVLITLERSLEVMLQANAKLAEKMALRIADPASEHCGINLMIKIQT